MMHRAAQSGKRLSRAGGAEYAVPRSAVVKREKERKVCVCVCVCVCACLCVCARARVCVSPG